MLVLTRKKNESIMINGNIEVIISDIGNDQVKIAIQAPRDIKIYRKEIYDQIIEENISAVKGVSISGIDLLKKISETDKKD